MMSETYSLTIIVSFVLTGCSQPPVESRPPISAPRATAVAETRLALGDLRRINELWPQYRRHEQTLRDTVLNRQYFDKYPLIDWYPSGHNFNYEERFFYEKDGSDGSNLSIDYQIDRNPNEFSARWEASISLPLLLRDENPNKLNIFLEQHPEIAPYLEVRKVKQKKSNGLADDELVILEDKQKGFIETILNIPGLEFRPQNSTGSALLPNGNKIRVSVGDTDVYIGEVRPAVWQRDDVRRAINDYFRWEKIMAKFPRRSFLDFLRLTTIDRNPSSTNDQVSWEINTPLSGRNPMYAVTKYGPTMEFQGMTLTGTLDSTNDIEGTRLEEKAYETFKVGTEFSTKEWRSEGAKEDQYAPESLHFDIFPDQAAKKPAAKLSIDSNRHWQLAVAGTSQKQ